MSTARKEPIAKVDTAWLRMEQPTNLMMITGVIELAERVDFEHFRRIVANRFLAFARFRQKAVDTPRGCFWEEDSQFEISSHIRRTALPGKADKAELEDLVSELASTPLDHTKPLWQFHFIENYVGGPVVVSRIHHCYADGIALVQVMLSLTEVSADASNRVVEQETWKQKRVAESNIFNRLTAPARQGAGVIQNLTQKMVDETVDLLQEPHKAAEYLHGAGEIMSELATALLLEDDPPSRFKGRLGVRKQVSWGQPLALDEVKAVGHALGATVNDVLIAVMTGALHRYLIERGDDPRSLSMRATVPVNLRPLEHARNLGNHFGLVFLDLPISESNPLARLYRVAEFMDQLKRSKQAVMSLGLLAVLGMGPAALQRPALELFSRKASTVLTNVPGPQHPLYLAGVPIRELMFWVPQTGSIGMGISIISYHGKVYCGLITDHKLVPDPHSVMDHFGEEFDNLLHLTMLIGPQPGRVDPSAADVVHEWIRTETG
ncbi:MAG: WS/DGAT/MGAT family O-acyltransferase [Wenzhouxiangella sp.]